MKLDSWAKAKFTWTFQTAVDLLLRLDSIWPVPQSYRQFGGCRIGESSWIESHTNLQFCDEFESGCFHSAVPQATDLYRAALHCMKRRRDILWASLSYLLPSICLVFGLDFHLMASENYKNNGPPQIRLKMTLIFLTKAKEFDSIHQIHLNRNSNSFRWTKFNRVHWFDWNVNIRFLTSSRVNTRTHLHKFD